MDWTKLNFIFNSEINNKKRPWILSRVYNELKIHFPKSNFYVFNRSSELFNKINKWGYINYYLWFPVFLNTDAVDVLMVCHLNNDRLSELACEADHIVTMNTKYYDMFKSLNKPCSKVFFGVDKQFKCKLKLLVAGKNYTNVDRKNIRLLNMVKELSFVDIEFTNGKYKFEQLPNLYNSCDYVFVPSKIEGGPMSLIEGIACGKKVIIPLDVGMAQDFIEGIIPYENNNFESLYSVLKKLYLEKRNISKIVDHLTWENFCNENKKILEMVYNKHYGEFINNG